MNTGKTLFSQLMDLLPTHEFDRCVRRYRGNQRVRRFSCRDQFLCMAFAQLTYRESLRDIETCLRFPRPTISLDSDLRNYIRSYRRGGSGYVQRKEWSSWGREGAPVGRP